MRDRIGARSDMSEQFAIDMARRLVDRSNAGLPVNRDELKAARRILAQWRAA